MELRLEAFSTRKDSHNFVILTVTGEIYLQQRGPLAPVEITGMVFGLTPGLHGFHIHQNGSVDDNCAAAGPHFNPNNVSLYCICFLELDF